MVRARMQGKMSEGKRNGGREEKEGEEDGMRKMKRESE